MAEPLSEQVILKIGEAAPLYYRLILVVAPAGTGKTAALQDVREQTGASLINVNLELSRRMLDLTAVQRATHLPRILGEIVNKAEGDLVLLDNIEVLFDVSLQQDPLRLLQGLSRNKTLVVAWNGNIDGKYITYAMPGHPEYRRDPVRDFLVIGVPVPEKTAGKGPWGPTR